MRKTLYILLYSISLFSCSNKQASRLLIDAETRMVQYPDSALLLLQSIEAPQRLIGKEQADYCLLLTEAMDKNDLPWTDSLITIAFNYYKDSPELKKKASVNFYKARYYYELEEYKEATYYLKEAEKWALQAGDDNLASLVFNHLGHINNSLGHYSKGIKCFKQSLDISLKLNNTERTVYNLQEIAKSYFYIKKPDSVSVYYQHLSLYLDQCSNDVRSYVYHNMGAFYSEYDDFDKALNCLQLSMENIPEGDIPAQTYAVLGEIYEKTEQREQAEYYWQKALSTNNLYTKAYVYNTMFKVFLKEEKYKEAALCADSVISITEAIYADILDEKLLEVQEKYDNESLQVKLLEQKLKQYHLIALLVSILIFVTSVFLIYRRHKNRKEAIIKEKIRHREMKIAEYKLYMSTLEERVVQGEEEQGSLILKHKELEEKIRVATNEIDSYKKSLKNLEFNLDTEIQEKDLSAFKGMKICSKLLNREENVLISTSDFTNIIDYYWAINSKFMELLNTPEYNLSNLEKVICILLRMELPHQRIALCLGMKSESLTRSKSRIKKERFRRTDSLLLEEYLKRY